MPLAVRVSPTSKRMGLRVSKGTVHLSVPKRKSAAWELHAHHFLNNHLGWIKQQFQAQAPMAGQPLLNQEEALLLLRGKPLPLAWHVGTKLDAQLKEERLHVWLPEGAPQGAGRAVVRQALEAELRKDTMALLNKWLPTIPGGAVSRLVFKPTDSQWGSMSRSKRLALSTSLVGAPLGVLEYVVVHELCHQIHMDHSDAFWAEVKKRLPAYAQAEKFLRKNGPQLSGLWARL